MTEFNQSNATIPCYNFSSGEYIGLVTIRAGVATLSFIACLIVIAIIILFKKYLFHTQRLLLYLDISLLIHALAQAINSLSYDEANILEEYCIVTGFVDLYTSLCVVVAIACFTIDVFLQATCQCITQRIEVLYVILTFLLPAIIASIPFPFDAYGFAGAWCWLKEYTSPNDCTRSDTSILLQFGLYYIPLFILYPLLSLLLLATLIHLYRHRYSYEAQIDPQAPQRRTALRSEIKSLLPYPCIVLVTSIIPLMVRIYRASNPNREIYTLWVFDAFFTSITGAVIAVLFAVDPETRHRLKWVHIRASIQDLFHRRVQDYPATMNVTSDSRRASISDSNVAIERSSLLLEDDPFISIEYHEMNN